VEQLHAESAPGQIEIVLRYCQDPVELADRLVLARETISQLARSHGVLAIFLPQDISHQGGEWEPPSHLGTRGFHWNQSLFPDARKRIYQ
jgi:glutamine synthetase